MASSLSGCRGMLIFFTTGNFPFNVAFNLYYANQVFPSPISLNASAGYGAQSLMGLHNLFIFALYFRFMAILNFPSSLLFSQALGEYLLLQLISG